MSTARNPPATHDSAVGAMYAIVVMCCMIYGTSCCQGFFYYRSARAKEDCLALRLLVISFLLIDGFHQLAVLLVGQHYIVSHFGDHTAPYTTIPWSAPVEILTHAFTALGFNSFCTMRLWNLTRNKALSIMALTITAAAAATNMSLAIRLFIFHNLIESTRSTRVHGIVATLLSILADSAISILLSYQLYARRTGLPRSNALVMKIIIFTLTSGLLTTPFHVGKLYIYITGRHSIFVTLISFLLAKFYTSAFITTVNIREYFRELATEPHRLDLVSQLHVLAWSLPVVNSIATARTSEATHVGSPDTRGSAGIDPLNSSGRPGPIQNEAIHLEPFRRQ